MRDNKSPQPPLSRGQEQILIWTFRVLSLVGIWGAGSLSLLEWQTGTGCPKLWIIPACYLILAIFGILLVGSFFAASRLVIGLLVFGVLFAGTATFSNVLELASCPVTSNGFPMCYLAFALFTLMGVLWLFFRGLTVIKK